MRTLADAWSQSKTAGNNFDAIRLFAAALVIFSHSFEFADGSRDNEPLEVLSRQISLGELAVLIFFAVSGFLITKSWQSAPDVAQFFWKRALRILPALFVVVFALAFFVGPLATSMTARDYFGESGVYAFLLNAVFINSQQALPGVFDAASFHQANAPLWTLAFEATCYVLVAILGGSRLLKPPVCAALIIALLFVSTFPSLQGASTEANFIFKLALLGPSFFAGAVAALASERIPLDGRLAALAAAGLIGATLTNGLAPAFAICGTYLVLFAAFAPLGAVKRAGRFGDFSYGLYLWGWPVQQLVQSWLAPESALANFTIALPGAFLIAVLSWRLIEKPMLALKRQGAAGAFAANPAH